MKKQKIEFKHLPLIDEIEKINGRDILSDIYLKTISTGHTLICTNSDYVYSLVELTRLETQIKLLHEAIKSHRDFMKSGDISYEFDYEKRELNKVRQQQEMARYFAEKKSNKKPVYVYLMLNKRNGYYKIGYSVNPQFRESTLCSQEPEIVTLHTIHSTKDLEKQLHKMYADKRIRGEWFELDQQDIEFIKSL